MAERKIPFFVRMTFEGGEILAEMYDSPASREFMAQLPLTLEFTDFARAEKIANLPSRLKSEGLKSTTVAGDFTYYAPWGNLAVFYKGFGKDGGLVILGTIVKGKDSLAAMKMPFAAALETVSADQAPQ